MFLERFSSAKKENRQKKKLRAQNKRYVDKYRKYSYGFHGLSETLLKFDRSETIENRELCFDD